MAYPAFLGAMRHDRATVPGDILLHPIALAALLMLVINDHILKGTAVPAIVTGKLSDVAGLVLVPLVLAAVWEWIRVATDPGRLRERVETVRLASYISGVGFTALQLSPATSVLFVRTLGLVQWLPMAAFEALSGGTVPPVPVPAHVGDAEDLVALPATLLAVWIARRVDMREPRRSTDLSMTPMRRAGRESNPPTC